MFNDAAFVERAESGELKAVVAYSGNPSPVVGLPKGSRSEMISYRDANDFELARAHRYVLPDGRIAASGKPDPKRVFKDGRLYAIAGRKR
jgi:hypothetical protein